MSTNEIQSRSETLCRDAAIEARRKREGGVVMVYVVFAMTALLGFASLAIDGTYAHSARADLQHSGDAAAEAAVIALRDGRTANQARTAAVNVAGQHSAAGDPVRLARGDIEVGAWSYANGTFSAGATGALDEVTAVRVASRRAPGSPGGPLRTFLGRIVGVDTISVGTESVAALRRRDIVLVQDSTGSFLDDYEIAREADKTFVRAMADQQILGDRLALVTFARDQIEEMPLTPLSSSNLLENSIDDDFRVCSGNPGRPSAGGPGSACFGTDISAGINEAVRILDEQSTGDFTERVIVLVTDGLPCMPDLFGNPYQLSGADEDEGRRLATVAADVADARGYNMFVITLDQGGGTGCSGSDPDFNDSLARGFGYGITTTDEDSLDELLLAILSEMPVLLVD